MDEDAFLERVADDLASLPGVRAVSLGGSRAVGTHRHDSDWDLAIYYRTDFDPNALRALGWAGEVAELGAWGGVFNGGAWLRTEGRDVDIHYRDLDAVEHEIAEAVAGRFRFEPLLFHLAGIPSYLVVGELARNRVLRGELPRPDFPEALRVNAPRVWWKTASMVFDYAAADHAPHGRLAQCTALLTQAASQAAHAVLAGRGEWVSNEKELLTRAGLREIDTIVADAHADGLTKVADRARRLCSAAVRSATGDECW